MIFKGTSLLPAVNVCGVGYSSPESYESHKRKTKNFRYVRVPGIGKNGTTKMSILNPLGCEKRKRN